MEDFGKTSNGVDCKLVTIHPTLPKSLKSGPDAAVWSGVRAVFTNYGAAIQSLWIPGHTDTEGKKSPKLVLADCVLGYPDLPSYETNVPYLGVVVGRVAGGITNAQFTDPSTSRVYQLNKNLVNKHCLHGGL